MTEIIINKEAIFKANGTHTHRAHKPVINLDTGDKYASATDAAEALGCEVYSVSDCCRGRTRTCKGVHLAYVAHASQNVDILADRIHAMYEEQKANEEVVTGLKEKARLYDESRTQLSEMETVKTELSKANDELAKYRAYKEQKQLVKELRTAFEKARDEMFAAEDVLEAMREAL